MLSYSGIIHDTVQSHVVTCFMGFILCLLIGLPTIPNFQGDPIFQLLCPVSRLEPSRDVKYPIF